MKNKLVLILLVELKGYRLMGLNLQTGSFPDLEIVLDSHTISAVENIISAFQAHATIVPIRCHMAANIKMVGIDV